MLSVKQKVKFEYLTLSFSCNFERGLYQTLRGCEETLWGNFLKKKFERKPHPSPTNPAKNRIQGFEDDQNWSIGANSEGDEWLSARNE